jgi:hypothetical protein
MKYWVRVKSNMSLGGYEVFMAEKQNQIPEPEWPELSFEDPTAVLDEILGHHRVPKCHPMRPQFPWG